MLTLTRQMVIFLYTVFAMEIAETSEIVDMTTSKQTWGRNLKDVLMIENYYDLCVIFAIYRVI